MTGQRRLEGAEAPGPGLVDSARIDAVPNWAAAHRYTPAPRHRRRVLLRLMSRLDGVEEILDAGCAQPFLLDEAVRRFGWRAYGCDVSARVIESNRGRNGEFIVLDLAKERWPGERQFDIVVSTEVLEHIPEWGEALTNLIVMTRRYLILTVPCGKVRETDRLMGHVQHFEPDELAAFLRERGLEIMHIRRWGFPFHTLYRAAVNRIGASAVYEAFSGGAAYGLGKRMLSSGLYVAFFLNDLFRSGEQLILVARKPAQGGVRGGGSDVHSAAGEHDGLGIGRQ